MEFRRWHRCLGQMRSTFDIIKHPSGLGSGILQEVYERSINHSWVYNLDYIRYDVVLKLA